MTVTGGQLAANVNIATTTRAFVPFYDGQVFGWFANNTIETYPAPVVISSAESTVVASVVGLGSNGAAPGLSVEFPGNAVSLDPAAGIVPYGGFGNTWH